MHRGTKMVLALLAALAVGCGVESDEEAEVWARHEAFQAYAQRVPCLDEGEMLECLDVCDELDGGSSCGSTCLAHDHCEGSRLDRL